MLLASAVVGVLLTAATQVLGHGRLMDPPARNSMWRLGFPNPVNYNDNELYCGGRITQWARNKGKCGVCGDAHHHTTKDHEVGGKYANGIISRQYRQGDVIEVTVHITANHKGYFEFRICPVADPKVEVTQECLDQHVLEMVNGEGTRYHLPEGKSNQFFNVSLQLPADVTCKQCVIQWKYRTGNTWDKDETGRFCVGCGPQEEFYNCADVTIHAKDSKPAEDPKRQSTKDTDNHNNENAKSEVKPTGQTIVFSDEAFKDKITDYGKQKVQFLKKLQAKKNSPWQEQNKSKSVADEGVVSIAQTSDNSRSNTGYGMRFGYLGDDYSTFNFGVKASQPPGVTNKWKSNNLNNPDFEDVQSRFGFVSSTKKKDNEDIWSHQTSENQLEQADKTVHTHDDSVKDIGRGKDMKFYKKDSEIQSQVRLDSHRGSAPEGIVSVPAELDSLFARSTTPQPNPEKSGSDHKALDKAVVKLHAQLRDILHNVKINPQQKDSFLRRWKMLRLRQIAARKALNSSNSFGSAISKPQLLSQSQQSKIPSNNHVHGDHDENVTPVLLLATSPSRQGKEYGTEGETASSKHYKDLSPAAKFAETHKVVQQSSSRQTYLKHKLPSWLVTTLKLKYQDGEESSDNTNSNNNKFIHSENGINKDDRNQHKENSAGKWYNKNQGSPASGFYKSRPNLHFESNTDTAHKRKDTAYVDISKTQDEYENAEAQIFDRNVKAEGVEEKLDDNEESANLADKNKESGISEDTESLVRYIVRLLLARKHGNALDKSARKSPTNKFNSNNLKTPEKLPVRSDLKNETGGFSRPVYATDENNYNIRKHEGNGQDKQDDILYPNRQEIASTFEFDDSSRSSKIEYPSIRAEVQPFNGLVLGSDFSKNQGHASHNQGLPAYSHGHVKSAKQASPNWETAKPYTKEDMTNNQIKNLGFGRNNNHLQQQTSYDTSYDKPFSSAHYQMPVAQTSWFNSQINSVPENAIDYHHIWSSRALNRQGYYNNKQDITQSRLQCRSLVTLGGGMDQWCTDNCNANFCPPSMCVCMTSLPSSSVYASVGHSLPAHSSTNQMQQQMGGEMANRGTSEGTYINHGYIPETGDYVTADAGSHEQAQRSRFLQENRDGAYSRSRGPIPAPSVNHAMIGNPFHERKDISSIHSINSIGSQSNYNRGPITDPFYSQYLGEAPHHRNAHVIGAGAGLGQRRVQDSLRHDQRQNTRVGALPYISNDIMQSNFQEYDSNLDSSVSKNWLPNIRTVLGNPQQQSILSENLIKPFAHHQNHLHNTILSTNDEFSRNNAYTIPEVVGQSFVGQNQFYPQFTGMNNPNRQEVPPALKCKAIGAYSGLKHFDEWCESTCQSTMCPLLMCSCDH